VPHRGLPTRAYRACRSWRGGMASCARSIGRSRRANRVRETHPRRLFRRPAWPVSVVPSYVSVSHYHAHSSLAS